MHPAIGAAASVSELRGPCDVANLSSLLGLSAGRAKAAISKNCRSLLCSALRKKRYYKETIQVERILSTKPVDSNKTWFCDGDSWDNISSGDGDLLFDDSAKFSSIPSKVPKTSKAIDFTSIAEEMASKGFRLIKGSHLSVVPKTSEENVFS
ncbi:hypothetical protein IFM89_020407 [Coptis chinensis]|uniref:Uncharacterized protein n=1 Tax=Coptis chinensis TaxID=261450 RepID=A0A835HG29_9MAGN|nr:hypothetical protein IFM89_020407 [Coptis chinensis]